MFVDRCLNLGFRRSHFDSINKMPATPPQMIRNTNGILAILGNLETQVAIRTALVVVGCKSASADLEDLQDWIDLRSQWGSSMNVDVELLVFLGFEYPIVSILFGFQNTIEGHRHWMGSRYGVEV